jgi:hypothetical protein
VWGRFVLTVALANERAILEVDIQNTVPRTARES